jgi:ribosomal protein L40E
MEMMIIALVALIAFAAVLIPLFRKGPRTVDDSEFTGDVSRGTDPVRGEGVVPPMAAGPVTPVDAAGTAAPPADAAQVVAPRPAPAGGDELEAEVQRYRVAVRAGTVCTRCGQANPADSRFCFECGTALPLNEAREFD